MFWVHCITCLEEKASSSIDLLPFQNHGHLRGLWNSSLWDTKSCSPCPIHYTPLLLQGQKAARHAIGSLRCTQTIDSQSPYITCTEPRRYHTQKKELLHTSCSPSALSRNAAKLKCGAFRDFSTASYIQTQAMYSMSLKITCYTHNASLLPAITPHQKSTCSFSPNSNTPRLSEPRRSCFPASPLFPPVYHTGNQIPVNTFYLEGNYSLS